MFILGDQRRDEIDEQSDCKVDEALDDLRGIVGCGLRADGASQDNPPPPSGVFAALNFFCDSVSRGCSITYHVAASPKATNRRVSQCTGFRSILITAAARFCATLD